MWFFKDREEMLSYVLDGLSGRTVGRPLSSADDKDFLIRLETSLRYALDRICKMCRGYIQAKAERLGYKGPVKIEEEQDACKFYFEGERWM